MIFFVTGGSRGIGEAIVETAIRAGHDVAFTYAQAEDKAIAIVDRMKSIDPARSCRAYRLDVKKSSDVDDVVGRAADDFGSLDVLVANAAVNVNGLAVSLDDDSWREVIDTNLSGTFYLCRAALPVFLANGFGRFIHISSLSADGLTGQIAYAASKSGLLGLSRTLAKEYGRKGITSNVILLGYVETDMTREGLSDTNRDFWSRYCPIGRFGKPSDPASAVLFLASPESGLINGAALPLTGGLDWGP